MLEVKFIQNVFATLKHFAWPGLESVSMRLLADKDTNL